ncbi:hypothetical protein HJG60_010121 [Phyllostomus discolor]|uniref:Uncharacterized protein n=1 Tax=Phyllostomus discolor TaxID=89673 RepID=A0A834B140_9CHIR|nr:hypothetical protein HJG60_010121 [Phyllostomus discolor]
MLWFAAHAQSTSYASQGFQGVFLCVPVYPPIIRNRFNSFGDLRSFKIWYCFSIVVLNYKHLKLFGIRAEVVNSFEVNYNLVDSVNYLLQRKSNALLDRDIATEKLSYVNIIRRHGFFLNIFEKNEILPYSIIKIYQLVGF